MYARQRPGPRFDSVAVHDRKVTQKRKAPAATGAERNSTRKDTPMSAPIPNLMTVEQLAEHYGKAKKTIQNKLTRGWGRRRSPTPTPCRYWASRSRRWPVLTASTSRRASSASTPEQDWDKLLSRFLTDTDMRRILWETDRETFRIMLLKSIERLIPTTSGGKKQ